MERVTGMKNKLDQRYGIASPGMPGLSPGREKP
jgi:hypothetical protein